MSGLELITIRTAADATDALTEKEKEIDAQADHELKLTTIDLTLPFLTPQSTEIRHQSSVFLQFKQWLGEGAPIAKASILRNLDQIYKKTAAQNKQTSEIQHSKKKEKEDPLLDYIEKNWSPSSKRGR